MGPLFVLGHNWGLDEPRIRPHMDHTMQMRLLIITTPGRQSLGKFAVTVNLLEGQQTGNFNSLIL